MKEPILVIMAAGLGSRYGGLKQMDPVGPNQEKIIDYSVYDAKKAGFKRIIFIINKDIEAEFKRVVGEKFETFMSVNYAVQTLEDIPKGIVIPPGRVKPWGTGHAVYAARKMIDAPFAVINADDYYGQDAYDKIYTFLTTESDEDIYGMVGFKLENTITNHGFVSRGICEVKYHELINITERVHIEKKQNEICYLEDHWHTLNPEQIVSMNMWGFQPSILDDIEKLLFKYLKERLNDNPLKGEFFLPYVVDQGIQSNKKVKVLETNEKWYGVTYQEDKVEVVEALSEMIKIRKYPENLWETL